MNLLNKNYIIYGSSILFSRGLEYLVLFYAAYSLTKPDYGELEFYKRVIEVGASLIAFGFPALLMSYTRSKASKINFLVLSLLVVFLISLVVALVLAPTPWIILVVPFIFYAVFFTGGISHSYFLVKEGSNYASIFKGATALLFYLIVFISIYYYDVSGYAFVYVNYLLFPILAFFLYWKLAREHIEILQLKRYWSLFKKLLGSSFS
ncbi:MAG: hypothetical protein CMC08_06955, partial [Flavobacteriaceae bacterium]|nr:hypothetical protein [Flavobacteriaceae bacterium]